MSDLTNQLAKAMFASNAGPGWGGVSKSVREIYIRAADTVIAHLTAAGRLIPAGGMALTAEQVENVRAAREELRGYRNFTGYGRSHVNQLIAAVDALFPATEPAEELKPCGYCNSTDATLLRSCTNCGAIENDPWGKTKPAEECQNDNHDPGCGCGAQHWMTTPAPAVPAEEETKAEEVCTGSGGHHLYPCVLPDGHAGVHTDSRGLRWNNPASSPVVPAPTETGPWQTWQEVPEGVPFKSHNGMDVVWRREGALVWFKHFRQDARDLNDLAPFVAAEEKS